jgi:hypothetical protein
MKKKNETQPPKSGSADQIIAILANSHEGYGLDLSSPICKKERDLPSQPCELVSTAVDALHGVWYNPNLLDY